MYTCPRYHYKNFVAPWLFRILHIKGLNRIGGNFLYLKPPSALFHVLSETWWVFKHASGRYFTRSFVVAVIHFLKIKINARSNLFFDADALCKIRKNKCKLHFTFKCIALQLYCYLLTILLLNFIFASMIGRLSCKQWNMYVFKHK